MSKEIEDCPYCDFCNYDGVNNLEVIKVLIDEGSPDDYYNPEPPTYGKTVRCNNCGAQGPEVEIDPYDDAEEEAIDAWNYRNLGKPERWIHELIDFEEGVNGWVCSCPVCEFMVAEEFVVDCVAPFCFCPACGIRLDPPKGKEE